MGDHSDSPTDHRRNNFSRGRSKRQFRPAARKARPSKETRLYAMSLRRTGRHDYICEQSEYKPGETTEKRYRPQAHQLRTRDALKEEGFDVCRFPRWLI
jgi:hypothetical protein